MASTSDNTVYGLPGELIALIIGASAGMFPARGVTLTASPAQASSDVPSTAASISLAIFDVLKSQVTMMLELLDRII